MSLKDNWKQTGVGLGHAFRDLGKSVVKSVATGVKKADQWANKEDHEQQSEEKKEEEYPPGLKNKAHRFSGGVLFV